MAALGVLNKSRTTFIKGIQQIYKWRPLETAWF